MYRADTSARYCPDGRRANGACTGGVSDPCLAAWQRPITRRRSAGDRGAIRLDRVETTRSVIDYSLTRRATLAALFGGRTTTTDVCDAHPYLLRAAKFHGEPTDDPCPVCHKDPLTHVTYTYGDALG